MLRVVAQERKFGRYKPPFPFVLEVARRLGGNWGLNGKRGNASTPSGDILAYRFSDGTCQIFDVLYDAGGKNTLTWSQLPYDPRNTVWLDPFTFAAPTPAKPGPAAPPGDSGSSGGGSGGSGGRPGRGYPRIPDGMHPTAIKVGEAIRKEMDKLESIPKGTEDEEDLPPEQTQAVKDVVVAIGTVAANFALRVAETEDKDIAPLEAMMAAIMPEE
jgi:hypothetical protein